MFMTGSWRCIPIFPAPSRLAFLSCRRPLCLFFSLPFLPHSTLHKLPNPPSAATLIPLFSSSVFPCPLTISVVFSYCFHRHHHHFSLSASSISFSTPCCFPSSLFVSLRPTNTSKINPPYCICFLPLS